MMQAGSKKISEKISWEKNKKNEKERKYELAKKWVSFPPILGGMEYVYKNGYVITDHDIIVAHQARVNNVFPILFFPILPTRQTLKQKDVTGTQSKKDQWQHYNASQKSP